MASSSDESDFYGDEEQVSGLEARVAAFDVQKYWKNQAACHQAEPSKRDKAVPSTPRYHNPYAGRTEAWQVNDESVEAFLRRLPPETTDLKPGILDWIVVCNPFIARMSKADSETQRILGCEDEAPEDEDAQALTFKSGGEERLELLTSYLEFAKQTGGSTAVAIREMSKARNDAVKEILELAAFTKVTTGKWLLFPDPIDVNDVWRSVALATANNELGVAAKVSPRHPEADSRRPRLVCIYTRDFRDKDDIARVLERMRKLGLVKSAGPPIYYKTDAFTYLGIGSDNKWDLRASLYHSRETFKHFRDRRSGR